MHQRIAVHERNNSQQSAGCVFGLLLLSALIPGHFALAMDGALLDPANSPSGWDLPASAIDTSDIPDIRLGADHADDKALPMYRLRDNTYFLFGTISTLNENNRGWNGNAGFVVTDAGVVVIDSLGTPKLGRRLIASIRAVTDKPIKYLIITHNHPDHAYGTSAFRQLDGITIIAHKGTVDYNHSATLKTSVEYRQQLLPADMQGFEPVQADVYINAQTFSHERISLGDTSFDIYNTGAHHSYGDLIVHQLEQNILWISDLAFNQRMTYMGDGDSRQILRAQDWMLKTFRDIELMIPGHGSAQSAPFPMVKNTHDYVSRLREAMRQAVEEGVGMYDAVQNVDFEEWENLPLYEQNQRANSNFVYREMEKAFFDNF